MIVRCGRCRTQVEVPGPGRYACPACGTPMEVRSREVDPGLVTPAAPAPGPAAHPARRVPGMRLPLHRGRGGLCPLPQLRHSGARAHRGAGVSRRDWEEAYRRSPKRRERFVTLSFEEVPPLGLPADGEPPESDRLPR